MRIRSAIHQGVAAALVVLALLIAAGPARASQIGPEPRSNIHWQSAGDSYSSGEGIPGNIGGCAQSPDAYGPLAAKIQSDTRKWKFDSETFTACTGHLVEDYFNARPSEKNVDGSAKSSLWQWGREQGGPELVDVLTMSFGGNDIGFADILVDCLVAPDSWQGFIAGGLATGLTGCDPSEEDLRSRIDALLDPPKPASECSGTRRQGTDSFDCPLNLGGRRGSIIDFYYDLVTQRLTPNGGLYIVGYPRLFSPVDQWDAWVKVACQGVKRGDTEKLGRLSEHLNVKLKEAVDRVNQALPETRVHYVDRLAAFTSGNHELCGTGEDWLNGIAFDRGDNTKRKEMSFHPNKSGHRQIAVGLAQLVDETLPETPDVSVDQLRSTTIPSLCEHEGGALVNGELPGIPEIGGFLSFSFEGATAPIIADLDEDGDDELFGVVDCSHGGVGWPNIVVAFDPGLTFLDSFDLFEARDDGHIPDYGEDRLGLRSFEARDGRIVTSWVAIRDGDIGAGPTMVVDAELDLVNGQLQAVSVSERTEDEVMARLIDTANDLDRDTLDDLPTLDPNLTDSMLYVVETFGPLDTDFECRGTLDEFDPAWHSQVAARTCRTYDGDGNALYIYFSLNYDALAWEILGFDGLAVAGD